MTPQEQQLLQGLADRVNQTTLSEKDPDAERYLQNTLGRNPDAIYILAQTVLVQQYALDQAKQQMEQLKQQAQQAPPAPKHSTSFLGNLLGLNDAPAPPPPPAQAQYSPVNNPPGQYAQQPQYSGQAYAPAYSGQPGFGQQGGGFLRSAMQTATGVAAGALAFEGIESLMHGFGEHAGYGQSLGGFGGGGGREEVINNNYYGDSSSSDQNDRGDLSDRLAASGDQPSPDIEDRRDDFADTSSNDDSSNDSFADSGSYDDSSSDSSSDFSSDDNS